MVTFQDANAGFLRNTQHVVEGSTASKFTAEEKTAVVNRHNDFRSKRNETYQPCAASDMEAMVWDDALAEEAQAWADGCIGDHAEGAGSQFGENLYMSMPKTDYDAKELASGVDDWYSEMKDSVWGIDDRKGTSKPGATCGHYWQVIWARSNKVGCGVASCKSSLMISGADQGPGLLLVCRYQSPASLKDAGDTNSLPYIFGKPCGACPNDCTNGLCTAKPTRCLDKLGGDNAITIGSTRFDSCAELVKEHPAGSSMPWCSTLAGMMEAEDSCPLSCGKCTVPEGVGKEWCNGGTGPVKTDKAEEKPKTDDKGEGKPKTESKEGAKGGESDSKAAMRAKMKEQMKDKMKKKQSEGTDDSKPSEEESPSQGEPSGEESPSQGEEEEQHDEDTKNKEEQEGNDENAGEGELEGEKPEGDYGDWGGAWDDEEEGDDYGDGDEDEDYGDGDGDEEGWWLQRKARKHKHHHH